MPEALTAHLHNLFLSLSALAYPGLWLCMVQKNKSASKKISTPTNLVSLLYLSSLWFGLFRSTGWYVRTLMHTVIDYCRHGNCPRKCKFPRQWNCRENANFSGSETDFMWIKKKIRGGKEIGCTKEKRKHWFLAEYLQNIWSTLTCGYYPSWWHNCEHSHLLLLSWAGNRLERSHSYTLFFSGGRGGLDSRVFLLNQG